MSRCSPGRNDPDTLAPLRVHDGQHRTIAHAVQDRALLAVSFASVDPFDGERIVEGEGSLLEARATIAEILSRLVVVSLESLVLHTIRDTSSFC
jgi:hypothetical protein